MRTEMKMYQAQICFNIHVLTNVFFGCGVVQHNAKQIKELKIIHKLPMIRKLGVCDDFSRKFSHVQKLRLGVGLIEPNTVIYMLATWLHVGNKILQGDVSKIVEVYEENSFIDSGLTKEGSKMHNKHEHWKEDGLMKLKASYKA